MKIILIYKISFNYKFIKLTKKKIIQIYKLVLIINLISKQKMLLILFFIMIIIQRILVNTILNLLDHKTYNIIKLIIS